MMSKSKICFKLIKRCLFKCTVCISVGVIVFYDISTIFNQLKNHSPIKLSNGVTTKHVTRIK